MLCFIKLYFIKIFCLFIEKQKQKKKKYDMEIQKGVVFGDSSLTKNKVVWRMT